MGDDLTAAERSVGLRVASGRRNDEIAHELGISEARVAAYLERAYRKTGARSSADLARSLAARTKTGGER